MTSSSASPNSRSSFVEAFLTERPKDGVELIQGRLRKALKLNDELAEYFKERAHVEDLYAKSLSRISKKYFVTDKSSLGHLLPVWEMLHNEITELYTIHAVMSLKITEDVERPLRTAIQNDAEYAAIKSMDGNFQRIIREYDERLARVVKHKRNASKTGSNKKYNESEGKLMDANKQLEEIKAQWLRSGPEYLQKHQTVDENRWKALKTAIQNFEVLQNDQMLKRVEVANNVLTAASNFNIEDEISSFCASRPSNVPLLKVDHSDSAQTPSTAPTSLYEDSEHVERTATSLDSLDANGPVPVPSISGQSRRTTSSKKAGKERKFLSTLASIRRKPKASENGYVNADLEPPVMHYNDHLNNSSLATDDHSFLSNGVSSERDGSIHQSTLQQSPSDGMPSPAPTSPASLNSPSLRKAPSISESLSGSVQQAPRTLVDAEGYSIPPPDRAAWPGDSNAGAILDDDFGSDSGSLFSNHQQRLKVDIKNDVKEEDATHAAVALTRVSSLLKEKSTVGSGKRRGRRENMRATRLLDPVQEQQPQPSVTVQSSQPESVVPDSSQPTSPFEDTFGTPATLSTSDQVPSIKVHVTEVIHALLKGGDVVRTTVLGEVKIAYEGPSETNGPVCFRLDHAEELERIAPNQSYVKSLEGRPGVYQLDTHMFHLAGGSPVACFKYQVKVDTPDHVIPIWVKPMWKCDQEQTLLLVKYRKTGSLLRDVQRVFFMTTVNGNVQNVQSIPAGQWMVEQEKMVWPLEDWQPQEEMTLRAKFITKQQGEPQQIAVRFEARDWLVSSVAITQGDEHDSGLVWAHIAATERSVRSGKYVAEA